MNQSHICQSCSMPIESAELRGLEADGSKSNEFCTYCYQDGKYTDPNLSFDDMENIVAEQIESMKLPYELKIGMINLSKKLLPGLKRWKSID